MLKDIHNYNARAVAAGLLLALMTGTAFAQLLPTAPALGQSANGVEQIEAATPLTLQKAVALALEANLDLTVAQREIEAVEGQVIQGRVRPNPELAYSLEDQRTPTRTQSVQINLPIELGGKRAARIAAAERGRDVAVEELNTRRVEIRAAVVAAFFEALAAQDRTALAQDSVDLARQATDAVAKRVTAGKVSPVEETKARVAEAGVRVELAQAQSEQRSARARLASVRGEIDVLQREVLPGAKSAYDAATVGFGYGKFNFLEVLDAQRTYFAAKSQYLKALADAHRAAADMDRVIGASESTTTLPANKE